MTSPFPGMDPYLEQHWLDVHHRLCTYACDALQPQLRPTFVARIEERLVVEADEGPNREIYPDVKIVRDKRSHEADVRPATDAATAVLDEPLVLRVPSERPTEGFINIIDPRTGGKIITVIEFLSSSNKFPGEGQKQYRRKQQELLEAGVSLVEIDLIRDGDWIVQAPVSIVPFKGRTIYRVCVRRGWKPEEYEFYPITLDQRLPSIRIPLRESDPDVRLNLQTILEQVYTNGAYDSIDYTQPLVPPVDEHATAWINDLLRSAGRR